MPLFVALVFTEDDFVMVVMTALMLVMIGIATTFFVRAGIRWDSMKVLLQEESYTVEKKKNRKERSGLCTLYWLIVVVLFFVLDVDPVVFWPVSGIGYAIVITVRNMFFKKE